MQSGTSVDAIDIAVVDIAAVASDVDAAGTRLQVRVIDYRETDWGPDLRARLHAAISLDTADAGEWTRLHTQAGQAFADAAAAVVSEIGPVDAIVSHGQTLYHWADERGTRGSLQIGQPAWIAERLGVPVVSDVRAADIAARGHGAPLMSFFDALWCADAARRAQAPVVTVNLGGIANIQVIAPDGAVVSGDTGPANGLLDAVVHRATAGAMRFDRDGAIAGGGSVDAELLAVLLAHPYFAAPPPKTTGRETFSIGFVDDALARLGHEVPLADLLATLTTLTVQTLVTAVRSAAANPAELIVSGGGVRNATLMERIRAALPETRVVTSDAYGIAAGAREAVMFAVLGWLSLHGVPVRIAETVRVAGSVTLAAGMPQLSTVSTITGIDIVTTTPESLA